MGWQPRKPEEWKVLLVSGHTKATQGEVEFVPGLEGEFVNIRESTARMSVKRAASLLEYALAWCADHHIPSPTQAPRLPCWRHDYSVPHFKQLCASFLAFRMIHCQSFAPPLKLSRPLSPKPRKTRSDTAILSVNCSEPQL